MKYPLFVAFLSLACASCITENNSSNKTETSAAISTAGATPSSIEVELDLSTSSPSKSQSFLDRIGWNNFQQRIENAFKATGQRMNERWNELKPRLAELGNDMKTMMSNRTAMMERIQRFANNTGILVKIRDKISEASNDG
jgi:hypothetical protein